MVSGVQWGLGSIVRRVTYISVQICCEQQWGGLTLYSLEDIIMGSFYNTSVSLFLSKAVAMV